MISKVTWLRNGSSCCFLAILVPWQVLLPVLAFFRSAASPGEGDAWAEAAVTSPMSSGFPPLVNTPDNFRGYKIFSANLLWGSHTGSLDSWCGEGEGKISRICVHTFSNCASTSSRPVSGRWSDPERCLISVPQIVNSGALFTWRSWFCFPL